MTTTTLQEEEAESEGKGEGSFMNHIVDHERLGPTVSVPPSEVISLSCPSRLID